MTRKHTLFYILLPSLVLIPMLLLLFLAPRSGWGEGHYPITGRYVETSAGWHMIHRNTDTGECCYVVLLPRDDASMFDNFETGDAIRVSSSPRMEELESGLCYTEVYEPRKVWDLATIPELTEESLTYMESLVAEFGPSA